jgi:hypothetical protein
MLVNVDELHVEDILSGEQAVYLVRGKMYPQRKRQRRW